MDLSNQVPQVLRHEQCRWGSIFGLGHACSAFVAANDGVPVALLKVLTRDLGGRRSARVDNGLGAVGNELPSVEGLGSSVLQAPREGLMSVTNSVNPAAFFKWGTEAESSGYVKRCSSLTSLHQ